MKGVFCFLFLVTAVMVSTEAASLQFVADPFIIKNKLSKKLQVRCAVLNPTLKQKISLIRNVSNSLIEGKSVNASKEDLQHDVGHLMSIVITKWNKETDQNETVASVVDCLRVREELEFLGRVEVEGRIRSSRVPGEVGYLKLMWDRPLDQHSGLYSCEASTLTSEKHTIFLRDSLQIVAKEPAISDIVDYFTEHDKNITSLEEENQKINKLLYRAIWG
ncbi:uncharacterized protein LOC131950991 [Physella acuta]|uniref:uncharacterized protein LOC131950991 n=1 Tax=Physella acuta TaxID=109671 RepID=UPI0027DBE0C7|nr:uncharacterized protein LOC131950991 [Physella acuta]